MISLNIFGGRARGVHLLIMGGMCGLAGMMPVSACAQTVYAPKQYQTSGPSHSSNDYLHGSDQAQRFHMTQNNKVMTADDFERWMAARGLRIAGRLAPGQQAPGQQSGANHSDNADPVMASTPHPAIALLPNSSTTVQQPAREPEVQSAPVERNPLPSFSRGPSGTIMPFK